MTWLTDLSFGEVLGIGAAASGVFVLVRAKLWPALRDFVLFLSDITGTPARNGKPAQPSAMETLRTLAAQMTEVLSAQQSHADRLTRVEEGVTEAASAAVTANGKADHMLTDLDEVKSQLGDVVNAQQTLAAEQAQIRSAVEQWRHSTEDPTNDTDTTGATP